MRTIKVTLTEDAMATISGALVTSAVTLERAGGPAEAQKVRDANRELMDVNNWEVVE